MQGNKNRPPVHVGATGSGEPSLFVHTADVSEVIQIPRQTRSNKPSVTYKLVDTPASSSSSATNSRENSPDLFGSQSKKSTPKSGPKLALKPLLQLIEASAEKRAAEATPPPPIEPPQLGLGIPPVEPPIVPPPGEAAENAGNGNFDNPQAQMAEAAAITISGDGALLPTPFEGKSSDDADAWLQYFKQFCTYKGITGKPQELQLFQLLMTNQSREWYSSLEKTETDTIDKLEKAFKKRYMQSELIKYRSARDIFSRKQGKDECVDDYVSAMKQMAKRISEKPDENMTRFAILAGLQPHIANVVVAKAPKDIATLLDEARIAELTTPPTSDSAAIQHLTEEVKRLSMELERNRSRTTAAITSDRRSPTPERRRVSFSPSRPATSPRPSGFDDQYERRRDNGSQDRRNAERGGYNRRGYTQRGRYQKYPPRQGQGNQGQVSNQTCTRCGYPSPHPGGMESCPAMRNGRTCGYCKRTGHFSSQCRAAKRNRESLQQ